MSFDNRDYRQVTANRKPLGFQQITALSSATGLTVPAGACYAVVQAVTASVFWRDDGTAPTSAIGMTIASGGELDYAGDLTKIQFISATGGINVSYYD